MTKHFDPLDYDNLGASIARALDERPVESLAKLERFDGAGIYALYYTGEHPAYRLLADENMSNAGAWALYIGKADAENARKGDPEQANKPVGAKLFNRIGKHRASIGAATNLDVSDFQVRALAVAPTWVPLAEVVAIRMHNPAWNVIVDGLGNHDPGAGRYKGLRPRWDTLHPGRAWAPKLNERSETAADIEQDVVQYLNTHRP
ncbi:Eco29kI family restriction endonuclease [Zhihengliuella salsuginis]|uniref:Type II restriction-modification system endonuclease n=1 Tax=Zhihengliuella salsuginis TaxID=578222 RepID=A0ABQ3GH65_9MICC|nr:Eco29kI family restriction endonuclease [Zhihengliuella salsuginis]GHD06195.1 type II restriction-modification system endonuclease [Zhihengliuella salsuginis]